MIRLSRRDVGDVSPGDQVILIVRRISGDVVEADVADVLSAQDRTEEEEENLFEVERGSQTRGGDREQVRAGGGRNRARSIEIPPELLD